MTPITCNCDESRALRAEVERLQATDRAWETAVRHERIAIAERDALRARMAEIAESCNVDAGLMRTMRARIAKLEAVVKWARDAWKCCGASDSCGLQLDLAHALAALDGDR